MGERKYRIICLKRSQLATKSKDGYISDWYNESNLVYWKPNRAGYTDQYSDAGVYSLQELAHCAGWFGDWLIEPTSYFRDGEE